MRLLREEWDLDVSIERSVARGQRAELVVGGGPVLALQRATDAEEFESTEGSTTRGGLHFGVAGRYAIGPHASVRHEVRARWLAGGTGADVESTVAFGWRFGP